MLALSGMSITKWCSRGMSLKSLKNIQQIHIPKELLLGKTGPKKLNLERWKVKMPL